jgi:diguanylate cyclase (GGDEF)-like protein
VKYKKFMQKQNKVLEAKVNEKTKHLKYLASHDSLTQLPNREFMIKLLQRQINIAKNNPYSIYVLFLDLDRFKEVNDTYGHAVGDQLLQKIAKRFTKIIDKKSVVGRVGGDEFVAIVRGKTEVELQVLLKRLLHITSKKVTIDNLELFVTASVGISHYPSDNTDAHELFIESDIAMYHAKLKGKNTYIFYDSSMVQDIKLRQSLGVDIRKALKRNEFEIFYQPKIDVVSGNVIGLEGLIRWFHPIKGIVNPIEFLPLAEEIGLIVEIDEYVREKALKQVKNWKNKGLETGVLSLNLSTKELETPLFVRKLKELIQTIGFESKYLELEILEHKLIENKEYAAKILTEMEQEGFNVAMDDFGTGYSSLAYLQKLPLTTLKIDRTFVSDIEVNESNLAIVKMILNLAKTLHINVIAEGVENRKQLDILLSEGCQYMQGYYFSKPLSAKVCEDFLFAEKSKIDTCQIAGIVT